MMPQSGFLAYNAFSCLNTAVGQIGDLLLQKECFERIANILYPWKFCHAYHMFPSLKMFVFEALPHKSTRLLQPSLCLFPNTISASCETSWPALSPADGHQTCSRRCWSCRKKTQGKQRTRRFALSGIYLVRSKKAVCATSPWTRTNWPSHQLWKHRMAPCLGLVWKSRLWNVTFIPTTRFVRRPVWGGENIWQV